VKRFFLWKQHSTRIARHRGKKIKSKFGERLFPNISVDFELGIREIQASDIDISTVYVTYFRRFAESSYANVRTALILNYGCFLPRPFQFIIH
jgi:hypothetical protein